MVLLSNGVRSIRVRRPVAASAEIAFVSAAREGERLTATAVERHRAGKSGIYDVTVRCGDRLLAEFRGLSRTLSG
ncbi:hypothetical protein Ais01nite_60310 [Asanoa ishikariensis]|uniref:PaaI family thioesterase n=1 Tax=Asanoa ishikariensis TaxID=137265 RepID=UPI000B82A384|nr:hotdog domain-containing protein [Asanoa ishikariensis]GIF67996.1 hypothetical protein Ais01nite_60310 [Asanoa ishikariensis]